MRTSLFLVLMIRAVWAQPGTIRTIAGAAPWGVEGPALEVPLLGPGKMTFDRQGNLYFVEVGRIRKISLDGMITNVAGNGQFSFSGDGGPALSASLRTEGIFSGIALDDEGNIFFADTFNHRIRRVDRNGRIETIAGDGRQGFSGDGGPAINASFNSPSGIVVNGGNLFVADRQNHRIRRIGSDGRVSTIAGTGRPDFGGDGEAATLAYLNGPHDVKIDSEGRVIIADNGNLRIRAIDQTGVITTIAGDGRRSASGDGGPAVEAAIDFPSVLYPAPDGSLTFSSAGSQTGLRRIDADGKISTLVHSSEAIRGVAANGDGELYFGWFYLGEIRKQAGTSSTRIAGSSILGASVPGPYTLLSMPLDIVLRADGSVVVAEAISFAVRVFGALGPEPATNFRFYYPSGLAHDSQGRVLVQYASGELQRLDTQAERTRIAGLQTTNVAGAFSGDGESALNARLSLPTSVALDAVGNIYIADRANHRIRRIAPDGIITTFAGTGANGFDGDSSLAIGARLSFPEGVATDQIGNVYIADTGNNRIRKISPAGVITTIAGNGRGGFGGDGGPAPAATISLPRRVAVDDKGNVYFSDSTHRVRKVTPNGIIHTVAGNGIAGYSGDSGLATAASLNEPQGLAIDSNGNIYIADSRNNRIRVVAGSTPFTAAPEALRFSYALGASATSQTVIITADTPRNVRITADQRWVQFTPASGTIESSLAVQVTANPAGLGKGGYTARLTITDVENSETTDVIVSMTISGTPQQLRLSQTGVTFSTVGSASLTRSIRVLNSGVGSMPWSAAVSTLSGGNWLSISPASGRSDAGATAPSVTVSANAAGLTPGAYFGLVTVTAPGVDNSPQSAVVVLQVLSPNTNPDIVIDPLGGIITGNAAQSVQIANPTGRNITYTATAGFPDGRNWFTFTPATANVAAGQGARVEIRPNLTGIPLGVYRGNLNIRLQPDNVTRTVTMLLIVGPATSPDRATSVACVPKSLQAVFRSPGGGFAVTAGWPSTIELQIANDCGVPVNRARVGLTFNNGDAPIALTNVGEGRWSGTWTSRNARATAIVANAEVPEVRLTTRVQINGTVRENADQPVVEPGGVRNAASLRQDAPLASGGLAAVLGSKLGGDARVEGFPWPDELDGTRVLMGGRTLPIRRASSGKLEVGIPHGVAEYTPLQVVVQRGRAYSTPETVLVSEAEPGVYTTDDSGSGQGQVFAEKLVDSGKPGRAGDEITIVATGLGLTEPLVQPGVPAPADPEAKVKGAVKVTIQGKEAEVLDAVLRGSDSGVYVIRTRIPDGVTADASAVVIVEMNGRQSQPVTIALSE
jgi:uncharacterized protein (TIGR03437 family)